jgi:hypothetical protein
MIPGLARIIADSCDEIEEILWGEANRSGTRLAGSVSNRRNGPGTHAEGGNEGSLPGQLRRQLEDVHGAGAVAGGQVLFVGTTASRRA